VNLAEEAALQGRFSRARSLASGVLRKSPEGSKTAFEAQDLLQYMDANRLKDKKR